MGRPKKIVEDEFDFELNGEDRQRVMDRLDLLSEADLCQIYRCSRKALQNRPRNELPPFFRAGGKRYWFREEVVRFFKNRSVDA